MRAPQTVPVNLVSLNSVRKAVPGGRVLFSGLELDVNRGEFIGIMGESGVGKSTLLNIIAGLDSADEGAVVIDGTALAELDEDARTRLRRDVIGFVFQAFHVLPHLTLAQNLQFDLFARRDLADRRYDRRFHRRHELFVRSLRVGIDRDCRVVLRGRLPRRPPFPCHLPRCD
jgi:putative ABC transport system ATP-binding protein